ncbi:MAG: sensor histidine kinase [Chloroflexota bacterium]
MDSGASFFARNIVAVYFVYGLAFFSMGLALWLESGRTSEFRLARAIGPLAGFGIVHGLHEWFEMFQRLASAGVGNIPPWMLLEEVRIGHLLVSFVLLVVFGVRLLYSGLREAGNERLFAYATAITLTLVWLASVLATHRLYHPTGVDFTTALDVLARYILGVPGASLAAWAMILERRTFRQRGMETAAQAILWAAVALGLYGVVGQLFPRPSYLFPANVVNAELFQRLFGIPIQLFRAVMAAAVAVAMIRTLRAFEVERQQRLLAAQEARLAAQQEAMATQQRAQAATEALYQELRARDALRQQLLHQVVTAQEKERQRVARELHDGPGQTLTALGLGMAALGESLKADPALAGRQAADLKTLNAQALQELHEVIADLRPSVLDNLGLAPALRGQIQSFEVRSGVKTQLVIDGQRRPMDPEMETVVFRIAQEALTNVTKHAAAQNVRVQVTYREDSLQLAVQDDGRGFDPQAALHTNGARRTAWGLLGIQERASLVGGSCRIASRPGAGTTIEVTIPYGTEGR